MDLGEAVLCLKQMPVKESNLIENVRFLRDFERKDKKQQLKKQFCEVLIEFADVTSHGEKGTR